MIPFIFLVSLVSLNFTKIHANDTSIITDRDHEFAQALETYLNDTINYYHKNSSKILDSINLQGNVIKTIQTDDPKTPENEEKTEEYTSHIITGYIEYEQKRDKLFVFKKRDVYYYDLDKKEFLAANNVFGNPEIKAFFQKYMHHLDKTMTPFSSTLAMILISSILIIPFLIMISYDQGNSIKKTRLQPTISRRY